jgi:hypothetical protein
MTTMSAEHAIAMIERYALAASESRVDDIAACFALDAELRDPFDGPIIRGRADLRHARVLRAIERTSEAIRPRDTHTCTDELIHAFLYTDVVCAGAVLDGQPIELQAQRAN